MSGLFWAEARVRYLSVALALRPTAGQRTLDPLMVVRIHQGQLDLAICGPVRWSSLGRLSCSEADTVCIAQQVCCSCSASSYPSGRSLEELHTFLHPT